MPNLNLIMLVAVAVVAAAAFALLMYRHRRHEHARLQQHFGTEYDHVLARERDERRVDRMLADRVKRVRELPIVPLDPSAQRSYRERWYAVQQRFVDTPAGAVREAHDLVLLLMSARGYPDGSLSQRMDDLSVHHPQLVEHFRQACSLARAAHEDGVSTEALRQSAIHYRALFDELLDDEVPTERLDRPVEALRPV